MKKHTKKLSNLAENFAFYKERTKQMLHDVASAPSIRKKLNQFKRGAFEMRMAHFLIKGYLSNKITSYDNEFIQKLNKNLINNLSVWQIIKDFQPDSEHSDLGYCYERSFLMFLCQDDAVWVHGKNKILELAYGKNDANHAWVEVGNYVYDPTTLLKYQKDLYYQMLKVSDAVKLTHEDFVKGFDNAGVVSRMLNDYLGIIQHKASGQECISNLN